MAVFCSPLLWLLVALVAREARAAEEELEDSAEAVATAEAGEATEQRSSELWTWSRVSAEGVRPARRQGHAAVELGQRIYILGGCKQDVLQCYNDVHIFDTDNLRWHQEPLRGSPPEPRGGHSASLVGANVIVYGGASSEETFGNVYTLDPVKRRWSRVLALDRHGGDGPGRRTGHAAAVDRRGRVYVFGGYDAQGNFLNDIWFLTVAAIGKNGEWHEQVDTDPALSGTWTKPASTGTPPPARSGHSFTYVARKLVLFGGYTEDGEAANDVYAYDPEAQHWMRLDAWGPLPAQRYAHSAVRHGHELVVAGGCAVSGAQSTCFGDVWSLNLNDLRWIQRSSDAVTWFAREGHSAVFVRGRMFTFGGCELRAECFNDVVALDSQLPCPSSCGHHGMCMNGQFCRCTVPGWSGHDCQQPLVCPADCGPHGACSQSGACVCENGWTGPTCSQEATCPKAKPSSGGRGLTCGGRGLCLASGVCKCAQGYIGAACEEEAPEIPSGMAPSATAPAGIWQEAQAWRSSGGIIPVHMVATVVADGDGDGVEPAIGVSGKPPVAPPSAPSAAKQAEHPQKPFRQEGHRKQRQHQQQHHQDPSHKLPKGPSEGKANKPLPTLLQQVPEADVLDLPNGFSARSGIDPFATKSRTRGHAKGRIAPKDQFDNKDFGVEMNPKGMSGVDHECKANCNFRGVCDDGICYCQPGYSGELCDQSEAGAEGSVDLPQVLLFCVVGAGVGFVVVVLLQLYSFLTKGASAEAQMGLKS